MLTLERERESKYVHSTVYTYVFYTSSTIIFGSHIYDTCEHPNPINLKLAAHLILMCHKLFHRTSTFIRPQTEISRLIRIHLYMRVYVQVFDKVYRF